MQGPCRADALGEGRKVELITEAAAQFLQRRINRLTQPRSSLSGGRSECHPKLMRLLIHGKKQSQQSCCRVGLARSRAASDDGQSGAQGNGAGQLLPIDLGGGSVRFVRCVEKAVQPLTRQCLVDAQACSGALQHLTRNVTFMKPVAAQVEQRLRWRATEYQRLALVNDF